MGQRLSARARSRPNGPTASSLSRTLHCFAPERLPPCTVSPRLLLKRRSVAAGTFKRVLPHELRTCSVYVVQREIAAFITAMDVQRARGKPESVFLVQECPLPGDAVVEPGPVPPALLQALVRRKAPSQGCAEAT